MHLTYLRINNGIYCKYILKNLILLSYKKEFENNFQQPISRKLLENKKSP
ncbi:hypothetical protein GCM10008018_45810 [Paenibacillus marchantiophytorum]|uniref:Uncharacterized protein n=1 Tax=Paenibacillus marchantiophytorum TaxID=1619310 RepID=A0ABQ1EZ58_9BACL|nr:hypothetical protein GCM10008018_45810 [Paenibacillus marchantiophytorum]